MLYMKLLFCLLDEDKFSTLISGLSDFAVLGNLVVGTSVNDFTPNATE